MLLLEIFGYWTPRNNPVPSGYNSRVSLGAVQNISEGPIPDWGTLVPKEPTNSAVLFYYYGIFQRKTSLRKDTDY
jgi:hypothetical protein